MLLPIQNKIKPGQISSMVLEKKMNKVAKIYMLQHRTVESPYSENFRYERRKHGVYRNKHDPEDSFYTGAGLGGWTRDWKPAPGAWGAGARARAMMLSIRSNPLGNNMTGTRARAAPRKSCDRSSSRAARRDASTSTCKRSNNL